MPGRGATGPWARTTSTRPSRVKPWCASRPSIIYSKGYGQNGRHAVNGSGSRGVANEPPSDYGTDSQFWRKLVFERNQIIMKVAQHFKVEIEEARVVVAPIFWSFSMANLP